MPDPQTIHGERARQAILTEGLRQWPHVTARGIGKALGMSHTGCLWHWRPHGIDALKDAVAAEAVRRGDVRVVRMLIVSGHPAVAGLSAEQRSVYLAGA